ncbi:MAG: chemotaxis protein CheB [Myxococcota bacterium]|nr:chemotaxis protein CheB [Myxococcota bacterium]
MAYKAVVMGVSAGGLAAISEILSQLPTGFNLPLLVVQHVHPRQDAAIGNLYNNICPLPVKEAEDKEEIAPGCVYFAPPNYHLLVERSGTVALSADEKVNWARPSIDVLFESAVYAWGGQLVGIILTGANNDGARGLKLIRAAGGYTIAQDPTTAEYPEMPQSALDAGAVLEVLPLGEIGLRLSLFGNGKANDN